jgi:threonine/homoserine/homoserine lactone efflux protein
MFIELIADILIPSLGIAFSPIPIIAITLVLGVPNAQKRGVFFTSGWILGLITICTILLLATNILESTNSIPLIIESLLRIGLGILLLILAFKKWLNRPKNGEVPKIPKFLDAIGKANSRESLKHGFILSALNPKNVAFCLASVASITYLGLDKSINIAAISLFILFCSITILIPLFYYIFFTKSATKKLFSIKEFTIKNNTIILTIVLLIISLMLLKNGISGII